MKKTVFSTLLLSMAIAATAHTADIKDTTFVYNNKKINIKDNEKELSVSAFHIDAHGDTIVLNKTYEAVFTNDRSVERRYENRFEISVPDIFKPREKRYNFSPHWGGFGIGFANLPQGTNFNSELASVINAGKSLQYNINIGDVAYRLGKSRYKLVSGVGIQFNAIHLQTNKAIEVINYASVLTTLPQGTDYYRSRLHYTYLKAPLLLEGNYYLGHHSNLFLSAGIVAKVKTASSSKVWHRENGSKRKEKMSGDLNIRPITYDILVQAGIDDVGMFASSSPLSLFMNNKGPEANQFTVGLHYYF